MLYDLIIIGAGPAGLSAAIYAVRKKIKTLVLTDSFGGQIVDAPMVENYLGLPEISGLDLIEKFRAHAKKFALEIKENCEIQKISPMSNDLFEIETDLGSFSAKAIIVTSGKKYRELDVPGAKEFDGKGISYCATCDAPLFKNKNVAVIGAGDAGQDAVWQLTQYAAKIYLLNKYPDLRGANIQMQEKLKSNEKVEIYNNYEPIEVKGDKFVKALVFKHNGHGEIKEIAVNGIFVEIGSVPASKFLADIVKLNEKGEVVIDQKTNETSRPGIFAAGDITDIAHKQMIIAAGEGAKAALTAWEYLKNK
ncbi:MAG TPA: FAD-dependent oxidoreductase [Candidatus Portnoybacteria bacterium]|nr:FAD-dependent oxidoreductase [Candidatus Portnoybacteria bacterium]